VGIAPGRVIQQRGLMAKSTAKKKWSAKVTRQSHALALESAVFTWKDPARIAASLNKSAQNSTNRRADPYRSALSMLTFYINRAGKNLPNDKKKILTAAKAQLKKQFGK